MPPLSPKGKAKPKLRLPRPHSDAGAPAIEFAVPVQEIVQKLEPENRTPGPRKADGSLFTKEVILTMVGGALLLAGAVLYARSDRTPAPEPPPPPIVAPAPPPVADGTPPPPDPPPTPKIASDPTPEVRKATTPLLSVLSNPSGAQVEINGTIYGTTPLIQPSPPNVKSLSIRLLKSNFRTYETVLTPNEAGHFNLSANLEKR